MSSMKRLQASGFVTLWLRMSISTLAIKMLAKETAILIPIAVPCVCRQFLPLNSNEFFCSISH